MDEQKRRPTANNARNKRLRDGLIHWTEIDKTPINVCVHLLEGHLISVGVHGGQQVDAGLFDQVDDALISAFVLLAQVLHQVEEKLAAQHLVPMHPRNVPELWFSWRGRQKADTRSQSSEKVLL